MNSPESSGNSEGGGTSALESHPEGEKQSQSEKSDFVSNRVNETFIEV